MGVFPFGLKKRKKKKKLGISAEGQAQ